MLDRINFTCGNFEDGDGLNGPYEFINSIGVLHHLSSPQRGLAQLENHLAPNGVMSLMVYSHTNRRDFQSAQRIIDLLTKDLDDETEREDTAIAICRKGSETTNQLHETFKGAVERYEQGHPQFADTMLNPQEVSYSFHELMAFLATAGLELVSPTMPILWDPQDCLPEAAYDRFVRLPQLEQLEIADRLLGSLFWILAKRRAENTQTRPCLEDAELFWDLVPMPKALSVHAVKQLLVNSRTERWEVPVQEIGKDAVRIHSYGSWTSFHRIAKDMLEIIDGQRSLREIGQLAATIYGVPFEDVKQTLQRYLHRLIDQMTLATPDVTHCHGCPLRQSKTLPHPASAAGGSGRI